MQAGALKLYCWRRACVGLSSLWNWNTKERFYFLSQRPGILWSPFSFQLFFFLQPSPKIMLIQVYMVWRQWLVSCRMTLEGLWHPGSMSPSLLGAPIVTFKQREADSIMTHPFWNTSCYSKSMLFTVWLSFPWRLCLGRRDIEIFAMCKQ